MRNTARALEILGFLTVLMIAAVTRFWNLSFPNKLVFDETYYVKDALTLSLEGHEKKWPEAANQAFESGNVYGYLEEAAFVVHPPLGKWLIASGMWLFGPESSFGWRFSTAIAGILTVALLMLVAKKLFGSKKLAIAAGFLLAIDGLAITLSRTALLDTSLTLFLLLGFYFLLQDQNGSRVSIAGKLASGSNSLVWFRPWLILTGATLGAAASIKWSGLYLLAAIGVYVVISEALLRKNSGEENWGFQSLVKQAPLTFLNLVPVAFLTYLSTWIGWIATPGGYSRNPANPNWFESLWSYHETIYRFHVGLTANHAYEAHPIGWLIGIRPTAFFTNHFPSEKTVAKLNRAAPMQSQHLATP
jgi:dolichyl-phosphate-mannose-protein mannosyltransferase